MIFSGLLALDMDVGRKFSLQWLYNGALFPYLPLVKQPRSELINLFSKASNAKRSNHPTPLWSHFWASWHFTNTAATKSRKALPSKRTHFGRVWNDRQKCHLPLQTMGSWRPWWDSNWSLRASHLLQGHNQMSYILISCKVVGTTQSLDILDAGSIGSFK